MDMFLTIFILILADLFYIPLFLFASLFHFYFISGILLQN